MIRDSGSVKLYCALASGFALAGGRPRLAGFGFRSCLQRALRLLDARQPILPTLQVGGQLIAA